MTAAFETVRIHRSQLPDAVMRDYWAGFEARAIDHKFHYDSVKQSHKWLKIHTTFSPAAADADFYTPYMAAFDAALEQFKGSSALLIGLGAGGGEKDRAFAERLVAAGQPVAYYPVDVSPSLAITSAQAVRDAAAQISAYPIVCDLRKAGDLLELIDASQRPRLVTFFGMMPNFEPGDILPILAQLLNKDDILLASANLAPGPDYHAGVLKVLPQYDNPLTKDWLFTLLRDAGVEKEDGQLTFRIVDDTANQGAKRITAFFDVARRIEVALGDRAVIWHPGETLRLFYSYRYTSAMVKSVLADHGLEVTAAWETKSQEEGVYLCKKL